MFNDFDVGFVPDKIDEHTEGQLRGAFERMAEIMGPDKFRDLTIKTLLAMEPILRKQCNSGDPALQLLDEYHAEQRRMERGFE